MTDQDQLKTRDLIKELQHLHTVFPGKWRFPPATEAASTAREGMIETRAEAVATVLDLDARDLLTWYYEDLAEAARQPFDTEDYSPLTFFALHVDECRAALAAAEEAARRVYAISRYAEVGRIEMEAAATANDPDADPMSVVVRQAAILEVSKAFDAVANPKAANPVDRWPLGEPEA